jgi:hypothetical protein
MRNFGETTDIEGDSDGEKVKKEKKNNGCSGDPAETIANSALG